MRKETEVIDLNYGRAKDYKKNEEVEFQKDTMDSKGIESNHQYSSVKLTATENKETNLSILDNPKDSNIDLDIPNKEPDHPLLGSHMFLPDISINNSMMRKQNNTSKKSDIIATHFNDHRLRSLSAKVADHSTEVKSPHKHPLQQQQVDEIKKDLFGNLRNSEAEGPTKMRCEIDPETRKFAERAIKESKIFVCNGPYQGLRMSLRRRGWVEKFHMSKENSVNIPKSALMDDEGDKLSNVRTEDGLKLAYMSSMAQYLVPTLTFTVKTSEVLNKSLKDNQIVNHFGKATAFTTKVGLSYSLRNSDLFNAEMSHAFFPRCYNLSCEDDKQAFIEDYNLTSCMSILKYFVTQHDTTLTPDRYYYNVIHNETDSSSKMATRPSESETKELMSLPLMQRSDPVRIHKLLPLNSEGGGQQLLKMSESVPVRTQKHVSVKAIRFALDRCLEFVAYCNKEDIGAGFEEMKNKWMSSKEKHWLDFQDAYRLYVTNKLKVDKKAKELLPECKRVLQLIEKHWPQSSIDGVLNIWILKPGAKSRGRGIKCTNSLSDVISNYANSSCVTVIQKYIEKPLLIYKTKFDLRQWFLITDWNPLTMWFYKDAYLRFCSKEFTLRDLHESIHLSNNSIQKNYLPSHERDTLLPRDNMWTSDEFKDYLKSVNSPNVWNDIVVPGMKKWILNVMICTQDNIEHRKEAFELFGADFMLTDDYRPWLIEINSSPSMARNTKATAYLVNRVLEDTIKVVIDRKSNPTCDTGQFELAFKQSKTSQHSMLCFSSSSVFVIGDKIIDVIRE